MKKSFLFLLSLISITAYAQDKIEAERPSESISAKTLNKHTFQTELGLRRTREEEQDKVWRTPNALFRYGLFEKLELRMETTVENQKLVSEGVYRKGLRPVELGLKVNIIETKNESFSASIVGQIGIPAFSSTEHRPDKAYNRVRLLFENKLSDKLNLNYNIGSDWDSEDQEQNWVYTFEPEFKIADKWETFVEAYGFFKKNKLPENIVDAGFAYYISNDVKLDLSGGLGLNENAPKYFVAAGYSFRL